MARVHLVALRGFAVIALCNSIPYTFAQYESLDIEIADPTRLEFSKDITSLVVESTLKSKCVGNVFVITKECEDFIDHALMSIRNWAPPVVIVSFKNFEKITFKEKEFWKFFISW